MRERRLPATRALAVSPLSSAARVGGIDGEAPTKTSSLVWCLSSPVPECSYCVEIGSGQDIPIMLACAVVIDKLVTDKRDQGGGY